MDIQLHYIEQGRGKPLILLHGNGEDCGYFRHQITYFRKKYRVIAIDTRGHGNSPRGEAQFSIRQFADDLKEFMDEMEIPKASILGFSDGGNIAVIFALRYPGMVERLILNGANLNPGGVKRWVQIPVEIGYRLALFFAKFSAGAKLKAEILGLMVKDPMVLPEELEKIHIKTLVIVGDHDMIKENHTRLIADHLPDASLVILPGNHSAAAKNPEEFNYQVEKFLEE
ncbi:3-oxoadipate enol-lactonase 2 [uncultured Roseburia sp.]|uniref:Alpha/beta hydrolase n=1 Tax=Brotonthovivens ammoniilytica TaxID=2981725 RepID=A0ABT2TH68_9FIRM|nr:alpha/beta hydrolase [Brotonthovivens ammoniilytica]MCU6761538.1 alpha/beta hydrolase [Brotonthovivens ammoniilytica]SCI31284.1 3-oxoadipate enol-lactonase 2 [uncultured Roseburia sp.]